MVDKTTKKAPVKKTAESEKSTEQQLVDTRNDLLEARKSLAAGELVNPRVITSYRKDVARLMTKINANKEGK